MAAERIAIDASRAGGVTRTGTEWYSFEIIRALIAIAERPELTLYHRSALPPELSGPRVHDRLVRRRRLWTHLGLSRAMLRDRPDGLFVPAHVIPLWHPISIVTIHDLGYLIYPEAHPAGVRRQLDLSTRWNARVARRIVAISGQTRDDLIRHYGAKPESIAVIHSAVDHERFQFIEPGRVRTKR